MRRWTSGGTNPSTAVLANLTISPSGSQDARCSERFQGTGGAAVLSLLGTQARDAHADSSPSPPEPPAYALDVGPDQKSRQVSSGPGENSHLGGVGGRLSGRASRQEPERGEWLRRPLAG